MIQMTAPAESAPLLDAIAEAYAAGDSPRGEQLLARALDHDLPWNDVCAAAARGVARHFGEPRDG